MIEQFVLDEDVAKEDASEDLVPVSENLEGAKNG